MFPTIRLVTIPRMRNGPNGITPPRSERFPHTISMRDARAPVKNATYIARKEFGHPRNNPIKNASLTSPSPIPLPNVTRYNNKKNPAQPIAESTAEIKGGFPKNRERSSDITISGRTK